MIQFVYPQKFTISIVFHFSWDIKSSQEEFKTMLMGNLGGWGKCIMGDVEVANKEKYVFPS